MIEAHEAEPDRIYRPTQNVQPTTYYTVPKTVSRADLVKRLRGRVGKLSGRDRWLLSRLIEGWIMMRRHRRFRTQSGERRETTEYTAVPPEHHFREVKNRPGYVR